MRHPQGAQHAEKPGPLLALCYFALAVTAGIMYADS